MTLEDLIQELTILKKGNTPSSDKELTHIFADDLLLKYIANEEVTRAFKNLDIWYA